MRATWGFASEGRGRQQSPTGDSELGIAITLERSIQPLRRWSTREPSSRWKFTLYRYDGEVEKAIRTGLVEAILESTPVETVEPWDYGWSTDYRYSVGAAFGARDHAFGMSARGVGLLTDAVEQLLAMKSIRSRFSEADLWTVVMGLLAFVLADGNEPAEVLASGLEKILSETPALVVQLLANVKWEGKPLSVAGCLFGNIDFEWVEAVQGLAGDRPYLHTTRHLEWVQERIEASADRPQVGMASWHDAYGQRAA